MMLKREVCLVRRARRAATLAVALTWMLAASPAARALPSATLGLGEPRLSPFGAEVDVLVTFTPEDQTQQAAVFVSLLVLDDLDVLKDDPSTFEFVPAPLVADWNLFKDLANPGSFVLDTFEPAHAFTGQSLTLGTLVIDFELAMVEPGQEIRLSLDPFDSSVGFEDPPGTFTSFDFAALGLDPSSRTFTVPQRPVGDVIPEPATAALSLLASAALLLPRRRRAR